MPVLTEPGLWDVIVKAIAAAFHPPAEGSNSPGTGGTIKSQ
jgi:hypothetical protein